MLLAAADPTPKPITLLTVPHPAGAGAQRAAAISPIPLDVPFCDLRWRLVAAGEGDGFSGGAK